MTPFDTTQVPDYTREDLGATLLDAVLRSLNEAPAADEGAGA